MAMEIKKAQIAWKVGSRKVFCTSDGKHEEVVEELKAEISTKGDVWSRVKLWCSV
jgi:hypothetical protein